MIKVTEYYVCDICGKSINPNDCSIIVPVIFHTDQEDGSGREPYITYKDLDLCDDCMMKVTNVHGWGSKGYDIYELRIPKGECKHE